MALNYIKLLEVLTNMTVVGSKLHDAIFVDDKDNTVKYYNVLLQDRLDKTVVCASVGMVRMYGTEFLSFHGINDFHYVFDY